MKDHMKFTLSATVMSFCLLFIGGVRAAPPPSPAQCDLDLVISIAIMDFGSYIGGTSGTIEMDTNGVMIYSNVIPVGGTAGTPAIITLTPVGKNCEKRLVTFTMPSSISINNLSGSPGTTITITNLTNNLVNNPFKIRDLTAGQIKMGGTLNASPADAHAPYSGNYDVTVIYN
jgi:hypothetical protein